MPSGGQFFISANLKCQCLHDFWSAITTTTATSTANVWTTVDTAVITGITNFAAFLKDHTYSKIKHVRTVQGRRVNKWVFKDINFSLKQASMYVLLCLVLCEVELKYRYDKHRLYYFADNFSYFNLIFHYIFFPDMGSTAYTYSWKCEKAGPWCTQINAQKKSNPYACWPPHIIIQTVGMVYANWQTHSTLCPLPIPQFHITK